MPPPMVPLIGKVAGPALSAGAASIIGTGMNFLSGIFGSRSDRRNQARLEEREDTRFQRASADAKAAGLHPLFALGAAGAGSPQFIAGQSETGSALGDALKTGARGLSDYRRATVPTDPLTQRLRLAQVHLVESQVQGSFIDNAMAASELKRIQQTAGVTGLDALPAPILPPATVSADKMAGFEGLAEVSPHKIITAAKGRPTDTAGVEPAWDLVKMFKNYPALRVPQSDEGWGEDLTIGKIAVIIAMNPDTIASVLANANIQTMLEAAKFLNEAAKRMRMDKAYGRIKETEEFREYADKVAPRVRKRF